jgi:hypothetical protein
MATIVERLASLAIGRIETVTAAEVVISLFSETPQATALNAGVPRSFPRINAYVLIPNETGAVVAVIKEIAIVRQRLTPQVSPARDVLDLPVPIRTATATPFGTLIREAVSNLEQDAYRLERGVTALPSVGDTVILPTALQLRSIVECAESNRIIQVGTAPFAAGAPVFVHPDHLFGRHLAVLGNTGSGKSCSVAGLVRWSLEAVGADLDPPVNARFIILDPNGEYARAFADGAIPCRRYAVGGQGATKSLTVPGWLWTGQEWAAFTTAQGQTQRPMLLKALRELRNVDVPEGPDPAAVAARVRSYDHVLRAAREDQALLNSFGPRQTTGAQIASAIFELGQLELALQASANTDLAAEVSEIAGTIEDLRQQIIYEQNGDERYGAIPAQTVQAIIDALAGVLPRLPRSERPRELTEDAPVQFRLDELPNRLRAVAISSAGGGQALTNVEPLVNRIQVLLGNVRLRGIIDPPGGLSLEAWLNDMLGPTDTSPEPVALLDLSLVPSDIVHVAVAVVTRLIFEALQRHAKQFGHLLPTVLVLEEAHTFVRKDSDPGTSEAAADVCRLIFERIAREGRKFGLGLVLASQRPSELSATVLAQCNTFLLHRIVNDEDQRLVRRLVPDAIGGLLGELPVLPSQQAILLGWAVPTPVLVRIRDLEHRPRSDDPSFLAVWQGGSGVRPNWAPIARAWTAGDQRDEGAEDELPG